MRQDFKRKLFSRLRRHHHMVQQVSRVTTQNDTTDTAIKIISLLFEGDGVESVVSNGVVGVESIASNGVVGGKSVISNGVVGV